MMGSGDKLYQDANWLYQRFTIEEANKTEMAMEAGCSRTTIAKWLIRAGVEEKLPGALRPKRSKRPCSPRCPFWEECVDWDDHTPCPRAGEIQMEGV